MTKGLDILALKRPELEVKLPNTGNSPLYGQMMGRGLHFGFGDKILRRLRTAWKLPTCPNNRKLNVQVLIYTVQKY